MHLCFKFILFYFWSNTLHVSDGLSVHHQELKTVHTATGIYQTDTAVCLLAIRQQYLKFNIGVFFENVYKIQVSLKSDQDNTYFTWRLLYFFF